MLLVMSWMLFSSDACSQTGECGCAAGQWEFRVYGRDCQGYEEEGKFVMTVDADCTLNIDILSGILSGGLFGPHIGELYNNPTTPQGVGHFFGAIRIDRFRPVAEFKADMDAMIREVKAQPLAKGVSKIMVAGEREYDTEQERRTLGIPLSETVVRELIAVGAKVGVGFDL